MEEGAATVGVVQPREGSVAVVQLPPLPLRVFLFQAMLSFLPIQGLLEVVLDVGLNFHQKRACCFLHSQKKQLLPYNAFQRTLLAAPLHSVMRCLFDLSDQVVVVAGSGADDVPSAASAEVVVEAQVFPALASGILLELHLSPW